MLDTIRRDHRPAAAPLDAAVFADPVFSKNDVRFAAARDASAHRLHQGCLDQYRPAAVDHEPLRRQH